MDTPWLYIYTAHKLSQLQEHTLQLASELTASKWLTIRNLILEGFYKDRGREKEASLELYTPAVTYLQVKREDPDGDSFLASDSEKFQFVHIMEMLIDGI